MRMRLLTQAIHSHSATSSKHASTRCPSAFLRHGLDHGGRDTPATIVLKPRMLGNNAGLGSPITATHLAANSPVASWGEGVAVEQDKARSRSPRRRPLKGLSSRELRDRVIKQGLLRQSAACSAGSKRQTTPSIPLPIKTDRDMWEFPPARPTAPGRKRYRRGSASRIKDFGSNPSEVLKAKSEYADDKYAKSAVESVGSRLAWWQQ